MIFINLKDFLDNCKLCVCVYDEDVDFFYFYFLSCGMIIIFKFNIIWYRLFVLNLN